LAKKNNWQITYNNSCVLLFAEDPDKYVPSSYIRYIRYEWIYEKSGKDFNVVKDEIIRGPIPIQIEKTKRFLWNVIKEYFYLDMDVWKFISTLEFPQDAWLEWIINALTHRSYNRTWNPIFIKHYDDRIEISNPWPLPSNVTVENISKTRYSRNPRIARVLYELWYVRELNEWVKRIYSSMEKALLGTPLYEDKDNIVKLSLVNNVKKHSKLLKTETFNKISWIFGKLNPKEKKVVMYIFQNWTVKTKDLEIYMKSTRTTILKYLKSLIDKWILKKNWKSDNDPNSSYWFK